MVERIEKSTTSKSQRYILLAKGKNNSNIIIQYLNPFCSCLFSIKHKNSETLLFPGALSTLLISRVKGSIIETKPTFARELSGEDKGR